MLTDEERNRFHNALNVLKSFYIDDKNNIYDTFVDFHFPEHSPSAHGGPNFLGWHREFLHRYVKFQLWPTVIILHHGAVSSGFGMDKANGNISCSSSLVHIVLFLYNKSSESNNQISIQFLMEYKLVTSFISESSVLI